jgi:hypothetical protein
MNVKEIDHLCVSGRWNLVVNCRTYRSATIGNNTDHRLVAITCKLHLHSATKHEQSDIPIALDKLKTEAFQRRFNAKVSNSFAALESLGSTVESIWSSGSEILLNCGREVLGPKRHRKHKWISDETLEIVDKHREARLLGKKDAARLLARERKKLLARDEVRYYDGIADVAEDASNCGNSAKLYKTIRDLSGHSAQRLHPINDLNGEQLDTEEKQLKRWQEHFSTLYNKPGPAPDLALATEAANATPDPNIDVTPPSSKEVAECVNKLKAGKAPGACGVSAELLQGGGDAAIAWLVSLFLAIWTTGTVPAIWLLGIILPLWKSKGQKSDCNMYRGITLLSIPGKVFAHVLLGRIKPLLLRKQRPQQSGFSPGRSTMDRILALRLIAERRREFRRPLYAAYVDLKAAFDSIDRPAMWNILTILGVPPEITTLLRTVYAKTLSSVRVNNNTSDAFIITSGVRQGCVLAPSLFNTAIDRVLNATVEHSNLGASFSSDYPPITDLDFADDAALLADSLDVFKSALEVFSHEAGKLGLQVSWAKTKVQSLSPWTQTPDDLVIGTEKVEAVTDFTYLGSVISQDCTSTRDVNRRIGIASSTMGRLRKIWSSKRLSLKTKLRLYNSLVISVIMYGASAWTLTSALSKRLDAFDTRSLRRILGLTWRDKVTNEETRARTSQQPLTLLITRARLRLFGHAARLPDNKDVSGLLNSSSPRLWKRPVGRPPSRWTDQITRDVKMSTTNAFRAAQERSTWRGMVRRVSTPDTGQEQ